MQYNKSALTVAEQIDLLKSRGLLITDWAKVAHYLANISYYRLSAYWLTFQLPNQTNHEFRPGTTFEMVLDTYTFDRKLRLLLFDEIERIEIALRTQLIYQFSLAFGGNWYEDPDQYRKPEYCAKFVALIRAEIERSSEVFIRHYRQRYTNPALPPAWIALELASFEQLSILFKNLRNSDARKRVANHFGIHENVLSSWLETLANVRNICAHHARLWNRKLPKAPTLLRNWLTHPPAPDHLNRVYVVLALTRHLLRPVNPNTRFSEKLTQLFEEYPNLPKHYMGFPTDWQTDPSWS